MTDIEVSEKKSRKSKRASGFGMVRSEKFVSSRKITTTKRYFFFTRLKGKSGK